MTGVPTSGENELADRLSASVRTTVLPVITETELDGVRQYQARDRFYEVVNGVLRGDLSLDALDVVLGSRVVATVRGMDLLLERWRLPEAVRTYRGVRDLALTFGAHPPPWGASRPRRLHVLVAVPAGRARSVHQADDRCRRSACHGRASRSPGDLGPTAR